MLFCKANMAFFIIQKRKEENKHMKGCREPTF